MTLVFVNRYFHPDHSATSQMLSDLAFAMTGAGHQVTVITSRMRYDDPGCVLPAREEIGGVRILRVPTTRFGRGSLAGRAIDYLTFYLAAAWMLLLHVRRHDVIVAKTDPPLLSILALPIAALRGARLVNWLQDLFPEIAAEVGIGKGPWRRWIYGPLVALRNWSLRCADLNVAIGERMRRRLIAAGIPSHRLCMIANWADGELLAPVAPALNPLRAQFGLSGAFVVAYSGNLGRAHDASTMLTAIEELERDARDGSWQGRPVVWVFTGGGAEFERLRREVERRGLRSVRFLPYQPRERLALGLSLGDVHLISLRPQLEGLIVPSKLYGIAAVGRPSIFIGDAAGEVAEILTRTGSGVTIPQDDGQALAQVVRELADDPARCRRMGVNARAAFEREFDRSLAMAKWSDAVSALEVAELLTGSGAVAPSR